MHVTHDDGSRDARYRVVREYAGRVTPQWVARFCDEWIGRADTEEEAWELALTHKQLMFGIREAGDE